MTDRATRPYSVFDGPRRLATGSLDQIAVVARNAAAAGASGPVLVFDDTTGRTIDLDLRASAQDVVDRPPASDQGEPAAAPSGEGATAASGTRGPGRPRLGVVAREVTLLPRHWEWLNAQPGGASVALRKLVEEARRTHRERDERRWRIEAAYHFMSTLAGDLPGFEEAARALFADDRSRFCALLADWPGDLRDHATRLGFGAGDPDRS